MNEYGLNGAFVDLDLAANLQGFSFLSLILVVVLGLARNHRSLQIPLLVAYLLRVFVLIYNSYIHEIPCDSFERSAQAIATGGFGNLMDHLGVDAQLYRFICGTIYLVTGRNPIILQGINILLTMISLFYFFRISKHLAGTKVATRTLWILAIYPSSIIYSTLILREAFWILPATLGIYLWICRKQLKGSRYVLAIGLFLVSACFHRGGIGFLFGACLVPTVALMDSSKMTNQGRVLVLLIFMLGMLVLAHGSGLIEIITMGDANLDVEGISRHINNITPTARASYLKSMPMTGILSIIWQLPIRMFFFLFSPFPWMVSSPMDIIALADVAIVLYCFILLGNNFRKIGAVAFDVKTVLALVFPVVVLYSLGTSNYGTAMRHRGKIFPAVLAVMSPVLLVQKRRSARVLKRGRPRFTAKSRISKG